jgi:hypothetical protein
VLQVRVPRLRHRVVIDVDDVVEHPHRGADRLLQLRVIELPRRLVAGHLLLHVREQVDRAQVADGDLGGARVERDLGAEVRAVDGADVLLRRADVARVLERDPRMPGLEEHRQHLAPELHRGNLLVELQLAARGLPS